MNHASWDAETLHQSLPPDLLESVIDVPEAAPSQMDNRAIDVWMTMIRYVFTRGTKPNLDLELSPST